MQEMISSLACSTSILGLEDGKPWFLFVFSCTVGDNRLFLGRRQAMMKEKMEGKDEKN